jgi:hypothetical protein
MTMPIEDRAFLLGGLTVVKEAIWEFHMLHDRWPSLREAAEYLSFHSASIKTVDEAEELLRKAARDGDIVAQRKEKA